MWSVKNSVGRVVEVRIAPPLAPGDMKAFVAAMAETTSKVTGRIIGVADMTRATVFTPPETEMLVDIMRKDNPRVERTAFLVNESAILGMQIGRLIRAARMAHRRVFRESGELAQWLQDCVTEAEIARVRAFLQST
jgi:hypothetical protein